MSQLCRDCEDTVRRMLVKFQALGLTDQVYPETGKAIAVASKHIMQALHIEPVPR